ncbi:hypothetical protein Q4I28_007326 [Leishmania naiffi]|uniref:F-box domain-containing protein n=1 Tax=Leishmania naiffi TaxID=5678 RepID=A0AAW3B7V5_9TRYP
MKKVQSRSCRRSPPAPHAQRRSSKPPPFTSKTSAHTFSEEQQRQGCGPRLQPSSQRRTASLSSPPPAAATYLTQGTKTSADTLTSDNANGVPTALTTSSSTLPATDDSEAKDGMRRPPLRRLNSSTAEVLPCAGGGTAQQQTSALQQRTGDRSAPPGARPRRGRHLTPPYRKRRSGSVPSSSSRTSSSSAFDMQSTSLRSCRNTSHRDARGEKWSWQRNLNRIRRRATLTAAGTRPSTSSATTKSSKMSRWASREQWKENCLTSRRAYSNTRSIRPSSATSRDGSAMKSPRTSSDSWPTQGKDSSQIDDDDDALLSPFSSISGKPICAFTDVLPRDVYLHICGFLTEVDCCTLLEVSLCMHAAITNADSIVWRHMCMCTWMYKQGFQTFLQSLRALGVLARQEELEVQALQQHMLLLREQDTVFGESDVSATCDYATVLIRRRQHERAQWMAAAAATATGAATSTLYRTRSTNKVSSATTSSSSITQSDSGSKTSIRGSRHRRRQSRRRHRNARRSATATQSTSQRSGNVGVAAEKPATHAARRAEPSAQKLESRSTTATATSRASRSRHNRSDRFRDNEGTSDYFSRSRPPRTSSAGSSTKASTGNSKHYKQAYLSGPHHADDSADPLHADDSNACEKGCSTTRRLPLSSSPSSRRTHTSEPREKGSGDSSALLDLANASDDEEVQVEEHSSTGDSETVDRRERRVRICLPDAEAEVNDNANLANTSVLAARSGSVSRHRRRSHHSLYGSPLSLTHDHRHHHRHDGSPRQQQKQRRRLQPQGCRQRRSHREKRRKSARQRRRKRGRSRGPRSTGGGGGRHRSQQHRGQSRHHRSSYHHHHNPKSTKSSRRRRRRQRNAAAAAATDHTGSSTYFYQTATYEAIKSTTPVLAAQHVAPSSVPFKLGGPPMPSASGAEAVVPHRCSKAQPHPHQPCSSEIHACETSAAGALPPLAAPLKSSSNVVQRATLETQKMCSASYQVTIPQTTLTASSAVVASSVTGSNEGGLYWWQLTPEARQRQLRRMQQRELQQQAASSGGFTTQAVSSLQDGDELADEAALREWDELEASSFGSSSGTIDKEDSDATQEREREEEYSDQNSASVTSDDTEGRSELNTDEGEGEREGNTNSSDYRRRRHQSRKSWRTQSRSTRGSITNGDTTRTAGCRHRSRRQRHSDDEGTSSSASSWSHAYTAPSSAINDKSATPPCGMRSEKEQWTHTGTRGAASLPHPRYTLSDAADKGRRSDGAGAGGGRSEGVADRYDSDEGATTALSTAASALSEADNELIAGSNKGSGRRRELPCMRRACHPYTSPGISVAAPLSSSSRAEIRAERRAAKALEKRYEGIEEAMVITRSKSVLIHTLEKQTHAHLPRLLAAAAQRQHRLMMMNTRPAVAATAAAAQHVDPSLMSPTVALHRGTPEFPDAASVPAARAIILIGAGSSDFNGWGASTTRPAVVSLTAPPASHLPSSLDNSFATVAAATLAVPASPLHQLARISSSNALISSGGELGGRASSTMPCQDASPPSPSTNRTASLVADTTGSSGGGAGTAARVLPQSLLEYHRTPAAAAAAVGDSGVSGGEPSSAAGAPMQPTNNDEAVDEEEEQLAPVSWKFAFFMSRREARRVKITLQDLIEGMWVVCFRSSGRTHPIRFVRQNQVFVYPPLPTVEEEEEQRLRQNDLASSEVENEANHTTTTATATNAISAAPPLPFHILQGGAQLVVHQFPPMKIMRRNAGTLASTAAGGTPAAAPVPLVSAPAAATVTPAMMAERRFLAEPQATLCKLRLRMLSSDAHDAATFEAMTCGGVTGDLATTSRAVDERDSECAGRNFGGRYCDYFDSCDTTVMPSTATTNDVRPIIAQRLGFSAAYMSEVLGQPPVRPEAEHTSGGATMRRGCSAAASQTGRRRVFYGPLTRRECEAQQRREACFAPGGAGDVLNDWGWTITSQHVKIFSLDVTPPLYVKRLQRVADVEVIGRSRGRENDTGTS